MKMKTALLLILPSLLLTGCDFMDAITGGGDSDTIHSKSYEPITGKFVLYDALDKRFEHQNTYFEIDGSAGNFSLKYFEDGLLKKEGVFQRVITYEKKIGKVVDNLHFNVKIGNDYEHISTYTESFDPIDQFRIIEEYTNSNKKHYLSELPFVMGTYVREGKTFQEEHLNDGEDNYLTPTERVFTSALNGLYKLDEDHYFYFLSPGINSNYQFAYFQYYSSELNKPLEGFAQGRTYQEPYQRMQIYLTYSREVLFDKTYQDTANEVVFGYRSFDDKENMIDHWGTVDFSNGMVNSFSFEHLSRNWTDKEWDEYTKNIEYHLPDPINYSYIGGTYVKA